MTSGLFTRVTFKVSVETVFGDSVFVTGNAPILGNDTAPCPCHSFLVRLPRSMHQAAKNAFWMDSKNRHKSRAVVVYLGCELLCELPSTFSCVQVLTQYVGIVCMSWSGYWKTDKGFKLETKEGEYPVWQARLLRLLLY
jgi:hypothetical protein